MKITFKVLDKETGKDITDTKCWVLQPNGRLAYNEYGDLIGYPSAKAVITVGQRPTT